MFLGVFVYMGSSGQVGPTLLPEGLQAKAHLQGRQAMMRLQKDLWIPRAGHTSVYWWWKTAHLGLPWEGPQEASCLELSGFCWCLLTDSLLYISCWKLPAWSTPWAGVSWGISGSCWAYGQGFGSVANCQCVQGLWRDLGIRMRVTAPIEVPDHWNQL